jgi:hypothetical protein
MAKTASAVFVSFGVPLDNRHIDKAQRIAESVMIISMPVPSLERNFLIVCFGGLSAAGWLVPNHYSPWNSAWGEALAISGILLLLCTLIVRASTEVRVSWLLSGVAAVCGAALFAQYVTGKVSFLGDALMAAFYVALWFAAVMAGRFIAASHDNYENFDALASVWLFTAVLSVGIALVQLTGGSLGIYAADLPPGGRPFGNVAQPNNFCSLCFIGVCAVLWLHQRRMIGNSVLYLGASFLLLGMVASQSRAGWLQIGFLVAWGLVFRDRAGLRISRKQLLVQGGVFAAAVFVWPWLCDVMLLSSGRSLNDLMQAGVRLPYWRSMLDAIGREPWFGYGWQQVGAAQQRVALDHPPIGGLFQQSHNLALDLLLWNGIPIGGLIIMGLTWWFVVHVRACRDPQAWWLLAMVGGIFTHSLFEYPLEYAYFLIPVGLAMGGVDGVSATGVSSVQIPRYAGLSYLGILTTIFVMLTAEYFEAEENFRAYRMEWARIGVDRGATPAPNLRLLTQLGAFLQFARTEATVGMEAGQVDWMRRVSERFGYPPVMFRYALAAGLNDRSEAAQETLARICRIHEPMRCTEAAEGWSALQLKYRQLEQIRLITNHSPGSS